MSTNARTALHVSNALSAPRMATYGHAAGSSPKSVQAVELYNWNAAVSVALMHPLHIVEVVVRNGISEALTASYGPDWPWSHSFEQSLPNPCNSYSARQDLIRTRGPYTAGKRTSKVIPELRFVFWQNMFTKRHDGRVWSNHLVSTFPGLPRGALKSNRALLHTELESIRKLRNRIAHHEPIMARNLNDDFQKIIDVISYRCKHTSTWTVANTNAYQLINSQPGGNGQFGQQTPTAQTSLMAETDCEVLINVDDYLQRYDRWSSSPDTIMTAVRSMAECSCPDCYKGIRLVKLTRPELAAHIRAELAP